MYRPARIFRPGSYVGRESKMLQQNLTKEAVGSRLYLADSHMFTFRTKITAWRRAGKFLEVELAETAFFPEGGGQYGDVGELRTIDHDARRMSVMDTKERDGVVIHVVETIPDAERWLMPGMEVMGCVDGSVRMDRMCQHTAEHIVSGLICRKFHCRNVGFHLGNEVTTLDFDCEIDEGSLRCIEREANAVVRANLAVEQMYPAPEEAVKLEYRSKLDIERDVRLIRVPGIDLCACCAPHVSDTGEIGLICLSDVRKYKSGSRVTMTAGERAILQMQSADENMRRISRELSVPVMETSEAVADMKRRWKQTEYELSQAERELAAARAEAWDREGPVILFDDHMSEDYMIHFMNVILKGRTTVCGLFSGDDEAGYRFVIGSQTDIPAEVIQSVRTCLGARCGGRGTMFRGSMPAKREDIRTWFVRFWEGEHFDAEE